MASDSDRVGQLQTQTRDLKHAIGGLGDLFPGSLVEYFRKCGNANCHCAKKTSKGHPGFIVTREVRGKTSTKTVPSHAVERVRTATEEYKRFRQLSHELIEASAELGELQLRETGAEEDVKKNRTRRRVRG
ncbi:MAG: hypothetical protein JO307_26135 [Bryobacterales bacterium]|nr:hypothetical protein [Bryobacterales bacterium]